MGDSIIKKLQNYYNISVTTKDKNKAVQPAYKEKPTDKKAEPKMKPLVFPTGLQVFWDWWLSQTHDSRETLKNRFDRYDDLDFMVINDGYMGMASELYPDEATQAGSQEEIIGIDAKDKNIVNAIQELLKVWGYNQTTVRSHCYNLALYGDSFTINSLDDKNGFYEVEHADVRDVYDRIEFRLNDVKKNYYKRRKIDYYVGKEPRLQKLANILNQTEDVAKYYKAYLFGFLLDKDLYLPPWSVTHYRLYSSKSEFRPWGRSLFINAIALFRQLKASKNLMAMARVAKFPKEKFTVKTSENMTASDKWDTVNETREEYHNLGIESKNKDQFSVGGEIWASGGLFDYELLENNMRLEDIADIELLRDEMIVVSRIPKGYLIVDRGGFGVSGQSLLQQFKPFGRAVYSVQSAFLAGLTQKIRTHFLITGQFDKENTEFFLTMNFPVTEEAQDRIRAKQDTLRLASDVVSNIQTALGTRDGLPPEIIKAIFSKLSFLSPEEVETWVDKSSEAMTPEGEQMIFKKGEEEKEKLMENIKQNLNEKIIRQSFFEAIGEKNIREGIFNHKHVYISKPNISIDDELIFQCLKYRGDRGKIEG